MEAHIANFSNNISQLSALGQDLPDNLVAALLLGSLPEFYDTRVTALESRFEQDITSQLIDEHKRRKRAKGVRQYSNNSETAMKFAYKEMKSDC